MNSPRAGLPGCHGQAKSARAAFTLVELLVVITIIGMLVALLMPAVNNARSAAQQATCINNQHQYATAMQAYVAKKQYFPGYRLTLKANASANPPYRPAVSWQVALLPDLGRTDLYQRWVMYTDNQIPANEPSLGYFELSVCPTDNTRIGRDAPFTSYVVNAGRPDADDTSSPNSTDPRFTRPDTDTQTANGIPMAVFHNHFQVPNTIPPTVPTPANNIANRVRITLTDIKDGQSNTLMMSENLDVRHYTAFRKNSGTTPNYGWYSSAGANDIDDTCERGTSFVNWWLLPHASPTVAFPVVPSTTTPDAAIAINAQKGDSDPETAGWPKNYPTSGSPDNQYYYARPSSNHPGGVIATFVGGNTQFLRDDIGYEVYCMLMTPAGVRFRLGNPINGPEPPLSDGSFK